MTTQSSNDSGIVEIRVHGIGNKELLDALGHPSFERLNPGCEVATAPPVPAHQVQIVNWARSNTEFTKGFFWYIALPFTLINIVGYMRPPNGKKYLFPVCGALAGLILTAAEIGWAVLLVETILAYFPVDYSDKQWGASIPVAISVIMMSIMLYRANAIRNANDVRDPGPTAIVLVLNLIMALATGLLLGPAFERRYVDAIREVFPSVGNSNNPLQSPTLLWVSATTLAMYLVALLLLVKPILGLLGALGKLLVSPLPVIRKRKEKRDTDAAPEAIRTDESQNPCLYPEVGHQGKSFSLIRNERKAPPTPYGAAALVLLVSIILLHTLGSLLRIAVGDIMWLIRAMFYHNYSVALEDPQTVEVDNSTFFEVAGYYNYQIKLLDILALYGLGLFVTLGLCWVVFGARSRERTPAKWPKGAKERAIRQRMRVVNAGTAMPQFSVGFYFLSAIAIYASTAQFMQINIESSEVLSILLTLCHFLAYALILATALGQLRQVTDKAKLVADVVGFWPIRNHPLAGVSYRRRVVAGILMEMSRYPHRSVVLVGHSQGSVICTWLIRKRRLPISRDRLHLITCGSPLVTLYQTFFPAYFTNDDFLEVSSRVASWHNFWRSTDPIASEVPGACNIEIPDPDANEMLAKHGNYWTALSQVGTIKKIISYDATKRVSAHSTNTESTADIG